MGVGVPDVRCGDGGSFSSPVLLVSFLLHTRRSGSGSDGLWAASAGLCRVRGEADVAESLG